MLHDNQHAVLSIHKLFLAQFHCCSPPLHVCQEHSKTRFHTMQFRRKWRLQALLMLWYDVIAKATYTFCKLRPGLQRCLHKVHAHVSNGAYNISSKPAMHHLVSSFDNCSRGVSRHFKLLKSPMCFTTVHSQTTCVMQ